MLGILDRYFLSEVLKAFVAIAGTLMLIVVSMLFLRTLEEVNIGALNAEMVARFLGLQLLRDASSLLPPAFFLSVLVALGRMARDSELIALSACGLGPWRIYRALLLIAVPVALLTAWFALALKPMAAAEIHEIRAKQKEQSYQIAGIQEGRFYQQGEGEIAFYVEEIREDKSLRNVFIQDRRDGEMRIVVSRSGEHRYDPATGEQYVSLLDGRRYDGVPGQADYTLASFERYNVRLEQRDLPDAGSRKRSGRPTEELVGSSEPSDRAELQHRIASPLAIFSLALIAIPLSATSPRQRGSWRMFLAFVTYFSFFNLQRLAESWMEAGITPAWMGSLWYQLVVLLLVYAFLMPESRWFRRMGRRARGAARAA